MLDRLKIANFLLIEQLELDFNQGLTVVTGETGSGKSIIIDALMLLFGARAAKDIIRHDQTQAIFEAEFSLSNQHALAWLKENDLGDPDSVGEVICRRVIDRQGKNKIYINGHAVTSNQIKTLGDFILDIHTQHASITLLKSETQRNLLDEYAGITAKTSQLTAIFKSINEIKNKLHIALSQSRDLEVRRQILSTSVEELNSLDLKSGEWEELDLLHKQLAHADNILSELGYAESLLQDGDESLIKQVSQLNLRLNKVAAHAPKVDELVTLLNSVEIELQELSYSINAIANTIEQDPDSLAKVEERINLVFDLSRKYRVLPEQVVETLSEWQKELDSLDEDSNISLLEAEHAKLLKEYYALAEQISTARTKYAKDLGDKVTQYLHQLAITGEFKVSIMPTSDITSYGLENIEYQVGFNKGIVLQPLAKAASGGELSRTALALYLLLSIHNPPEIIIFDEIDVGIGGKVASIVGEMLSKLGIAKQVICITHQPQTASFGDRHLVVSKHHKKEITQVEISYVKDKLRVDEIARMLGGVKVTQTTLSHAEEMLNNSGK